MNLETQTLLARLETMERQARGWKILVSLSILLAVAALALPIITGSPQAPDVAKDSVVEARRFILRDEQGRVSGGFEVAADGAVRLVLGRPGGEIGAAFLEVRPGGSQLMLRGPDGGVRASLIGARTSSLALASEGQPATATLVTSESAGGSLRLHDEFGRIRHRAP